MEIPVQVKLRVDNKVRILEFKGRTYLEFLYEINQLLGSPTDTQLEISYVDRDGDMVTIASDSELHIALMAMKDNIIKFTISFPREALLERSITKLQTLLQNKSQFENQNPPPKELPFTGRIKELAQLKSTLQINMSNFLNRNNFQRKVDIVTGALGVGKTRLVRESNWRLCSPDAVFLYNDKEVAARSKFGFVGNIYLDFNVSDAISSYEESNGDYSVCLGFRIVSHLLFQDSTQSFQPNIPNEQKHLYTFDNVMKYIEKKYAKYLPILLTIHMDEFTTLNNTVLRDMLNILGAYSLKSDNVCISVQLTGLNTEGTLASCLESVELKLKPLLPGEDFEIVKEAMIEDRKHIINEEIVQKAITCLGRVPRYLEIFITFVNGITLGLDLLTTISKCFSSTTSEIAVIYPLTKWKKYLGNSVEGPLKMLLWSLEAKSVKREDNLNEISIKEAEDNGMLILEQKNNKLYIWLPFILVRARLTDEVCTFTYVHLKQPLI